MSNINLQAFKDSELNYRDKITPSDLEDIYQIVKSSNNFSDEEIAIAIELAEEGLKKGVESGYHFLFFERDGNKIGYTCYGKIAGTISSFDLYWIAVHKNFHNQGIGKRLLKKTESIISEMGGRRIYIETSSKESYELTRLFYDHCGYKKEAVLKDFYSEGDDKFIYVKKI